MSCNYQIEAIKFGIYTYFRDCEIENLGLKGNTPHFTKSEAFDEVITNHSLQEVRDYYCRNGNDKYKNNELPTYQDIARYVHDLLYLF